MTNEEKQLLLSLLKKADENGLLLVFDNEYTRNVIRIYLDNEIRIYLDNEICIKIE